MLIEKSHECMGHRMRRVPQFVLLYVFIMQRNPTPVDDTWPHGSAQNTLQLVPPNLIRIRMPGFIRLQMLISTRLIYGPYL